MRCGRRGSGGSKRKAAAYEPRRWREPRRGGSGSNSRCRGQRPRAGQSYHGGRAGSSRPLSEVRNVVTAFRGRMVLRRLPHAVHGIGARPAGQRQARSPRSRRHIRSGASCDIHRTDRTHVSRGWILLGRRRVLDAQSDSFRFTPRVISHHGHRSLLRSRNRRGGRSHRPDRRA